MTRRIDPMKRVVEDHAVISEYAELYESLLHLRTDQAAWAKIPETVAVLSNAITRHFLYEETLVFPKLAGHLRQPSVQKLLGLLQAEHDEIRALFQDLKKILRAAQQDPRQLANAKTKGREMIDLLLTHAAREDDRLIPLIRRHPDAFAPAQGSLA